MPSIYAINYRVRALFICVIVIALSVVVRHFHLDDSLIYARYISHALQGRGLEFNPGEPVNALTSILDTWFVLALARVLHGNVLLAQAILSCLFLIAAALVVESMVPLAGMMVAALCLPYWCVGMETSLFMFLLALSVYAYVNDRVDWLPLLCILTALSRFEGAALTPVIAWQLWKRRRFPRLWSFIPVVLLIVFYLFFNLHFYHAPLPQSATAKFGQGMSGYWGRWPTAFLRTSEVIYGPFGKAEIALIGLVILAGFGMRHHSMSKRNEIVVPFVLILGSFYVLFNIPDYFWYYAPFLMFVVLYAVRLIPETRASQRAGFAFAVCLAVASGVYLKKHTINAVDYISMAQWMDQNTPREARIASVETGTIGWYCDRNLIDIVGLTTPQNAHYTARHDFSSWITEKPDFIVVHSKLPFPWENVALSSHDYEFMPVHFGDVYLLRRVGSAH
jgi:hypothetical protein